MLHPPPGSREAPQAVDEGVQGCTEGARQGERRGGVQDVVLPRQGSLEVQVEEREPRLAALEPHVGRLDLAARPVAQDPSRPVSQSLDEGIGAWIPRRGKEQPTSDPRILPHPPHEPLEAGEDCGAIGEEVRVIHLHIGDDRCRRVVVEERRPSAVPSEDLGGNRVQFDGGLAWPGVLGDRP